MAKYYGTKIKTPVGDLAWVNIVDGQSYMGGAEKFQATLELKTDSEECQSLIKLIREEWKENKAKGAKNPKMPFSVKRRKTDEEDENGDPVYEDTDYTKFTASTRKFNAKGDLQKVQVFNAKGAPVSLGTQQIGNGSRGLLMATCKVYTIQDPTTKVIGNCGVSLYLSGIQLAKFIPYAADAVEAPTALDEGDFDGVEPELKEEAGSPTTATRRDEDDAPTVEL